MMGDNIDCYKNLLKQATVIGLPTVLEKNIVSMTFTQCQQAKRYKQPIIDFMFAFCRSMVGQVMGDTHIYNSIGQNELINNVNK